jgi:GNAT superfamily N-acetyltransferase
VTTRRRGEWHVAPVEGDRWSDLVRLFGRNGAHGGCWCMWWRIPHRAFAQSDAARNRARLRSLVRRGIPPGLIGYQDGEPVAWVSLGPRQDFAALETSRILAPVDDRPVWSIVCFFVRRDRRRTGWMRRLLSAAADYAADQGATLLEGYPIECGDRRLVGYAGYTGIASTFRAAGFREVARRKKDRPMMRRAVRRRASTRRKESTR